MVSKQELKQKMKSINVVGKLTKAMKMAATAKLRKFKTQYQLVRDFFSEYYSVIGKLIINANYYQPQRFSKPGTLYLLISSSFGMCGPYNNNVNRLLYQYIKPEDKIILLGKKSLEFWRLKKMDSFIVKVKNLQDVDTNFDISLSIGKEVLNLYDNGEFAKVCIVYTSFINNLKQEAKIIQVLPFDKSIFELQIVKENQNNTTDLPIEFEPDQKSVIDGLTPQFMQIMLYGCMIESKISEYASRKNAMETATNNANDLYDKYLLNYNQIRQSSITLEINEIIQGSDLTNKG